MRASICTASLALILAASSLYAADGPFPHRGKVSDRLWLQPSHEGLGKVVSGIGEAPIYRPGPATRRMASWLMKQRRQGDGGGGNVANLLVIQTDFSDPANGNVTLVIWDEETPNLVDITLSIVDEEGTLLLQGTVSALPGTDLPGANSVFVPSVPEGRQTFIVEGNGDPLTAETEISILPDQPFADVENFSCTEGETNADGNCDMFLTWDTPSPLPSYHLILLNGGVLGQTSSGTIDTVNAGLVDTDLLEPGEYQMTNLGFLETPEDDDNLYRGAFIETSCTLECSGLTCIAPLNLTICQSSYSPLEENQLRVSWANLGTYLGIDVFVNDDLDQDLGPEGDGEVPSLIDLATLLPPGDHTIGVQAVCENGDAADLVETTFTVLDSTPHVNPVEGDLACEFVRGVPGTTPDRTVVTWTNADPSAFFDVWVIDAMQNPFFLGEQPGDRETVTVFGTTPEDQIFIQFFARTEDGCYGSDFFFCQPPPPGNVFIRGDCNGSGAPPQITSAVYGLNALFGGVTAPCAEACDTNADGQFNISDMVSLLTFLFGGGSAPTGWLDARTPACETSVDNCEIGLETCPL